MVPLLPGALPPALLPYERGGTSVPLACGERGATAATRATGRRGRGEGARAATGATAATGRRGEGGDGGDSGEGATGRGRRQRRRGDGARAATAATGRRGGDVGGRPGAPRGRGMAEKGHCASPSRNIPFHWVSVLPPHLALEPSGPETHAFHPSESSPSCGPGFPVRVWCLTPSTSIQPWPATAFPPARKASWNSPHWRWRPSTAPPPG